MKFKDIEENDTVHPGEYLLHKPTRQIVVCGAFLKTEHKIKVLANGRLLVAEITDFQKVIVTKQEERQRQVRTTRCRGCSGN
tara:strand:- start:687 stop:932 length:246 start_codon:yes stop_codon:yes gene_type:complete